ncbi:uncharacterized protein LOC119322465 [Triticum dicoccoides]|uniref:uncharacterized protein LOC119322465 n=1 Tax=Triticum dicoccoides TaxID=85692 RepID=UPI001890E196|nr:uncharacterized protein LOC119322465 [Triticum dicoccoides]
MQYLMEDMTSLPDVTILILDVTAYVHSFGASVFHVLRMCPRLKALSIRFPLEPNQLEAQTVFCSSDCICDQPPNWKTEELLLDRLQDVEIWGFTGTEHEVALLKRLVSWATVLKTMTIRFHGSVTESKRNRLCKLLLSFARPETCLHVAPLFEKYAFLYMHT